jgi:ABC-type glycerol-3-phosphate transport system substrate-binding protein
MWLTQKAVAVAVAGLALAAGIAACGGDDPDSSSASTSGKVEGEIDFWFVDDPSNAPDFWPGFVKDFEAKHPGAKVRLTGYASDQLSQKLVSGFAAGNEPDVFYTTGGNDLFKYARRGLVEPLDDKVDFAPYRTEMVEAFLTDDGKKFGVPTLVAAPYVLWYDKALLKKLGVSPPTNWDELLTFCDQVNDKDLIPIALGNADQWEVLMWFDNLVYQYGGRDVRLDATFGEGGTDWNDPAFGKAIARLRELIDRGCFPDNFNGTSYEKMESLFFNGDAAALALGDWVASSSKDLAPKGFELDYVNMPPVPDGEHPVGEGGGMMATVPGLSVSAKSDNKAVATAFLDYFGERVEDFDAAADRIAPTVDPPTPSDPLVGKMFSDTEEASEYYGVSDVILPSTLHDDLLTALQAVTLGKLDAAGFGDAMNGAVEKESAELNK